MLCAIILFVVLFAISRASGESNIRQGVPAPSFVLQEVHGQKLRLADIKPRALLVCFMATWDEPSRRQLRLLNDFIGQYGETNVSVLAMTIDEKDAGLLKKFVQQEHLRYGVHLADYDFIQSFGGVAAIPTTYVVDKNRDIIDKIVGSTETNALDADLKAIMKQ